MAKIDRNLKHLTIQARNLGKEGKYKAAEEAYSLVLKKDRNNVYALVGLGDLKRQRKQFQEALSYYQKCLEVQRDNKFALAGLGDTYRGLGQIDQALEVWREYLSFNPGDYKVMTRGADGFRKKGTSNHPRDIIFWRWKKTKRIGLHSWAWGIFI